MIYIYGGEYHAFQRVRESRKPVVVLLHGGGLSTWEWQPHIEVLQKDFAVVAVTIDGHGEDAGTPFISIEDSG